DGIRDDLVTGVQTCALPISAAIPLGDRDRRVQRRRWPRDASSIHEPSPAELDPASWQLVQQCVHDRRDAVPLGSFVLEFAPSRWRQAVEACFPIVFVNAPLRAYQA